MIKLTRKKQEPTLEYEDDCKALRKALNELGYDATLEDIEWAWGEVSASMSAGWLIIDIYGEHTGAANMMLAYLEAE